MRWPRSKRWSKTSSLAFDNRSYGIEVGSEVVFGRPNLVREIPNFWRGSRGRLATESSAFLCSISLGCL